jgi:NAD dependent epimerase/dehydratase family enzyme
VRVITRNPSSAKGKLQYPGLEFFALNDIDRAVQGADAVVNLAGEPISTRWVQQIQIQITDTDPYTDYRNSIAIKGPCDWAVLASLCCCR